MSGSPVFLPKPDSLEVEGSKDSSVASQSEPGPVKTSFEISFDISFYDLKKPELIGEGGFGKVYRGFWNDQSYPPNNTTYPI